MYTQKEVMVICHERHLRFDYSRLKTNRLGLTVEQPNNVPTDIEEPSLLRRILKLTEPKKFEVDMNGVQVFVSANGNWIEVTGQFKVSSKDVRIDTEYGFPCWVLQGPHPKVIEVCDGNVLYELLVTDTDILEIRTALKGPVS